MPYLGAYFVLLYFCFVLPLSPFLSDCQFTFFLGFAVLKIGTVSGSNYPCLSQLPLQCISSQMPAVMALPQIACSAKVLAQHIFPQFTFSEVLPSPWDYAFAFMYVSQIMPFLCTWYFNYGFFTMKCL